MWAVGRVGRKGEYFRYVRRGTESGLRHGIKDSTRE